MGGLSSVATAIGGLTQAASVIGSISTLGNTLNNAANPNRVLRAQQDYETARLKAQQDMKVAQSQREAALQRENIRAETLRAEDLRRQALKRATARQRAAFGASGLTTYDGSGEAVLLGLFEESDAERQSRDRLDNLKNKALDESLASQMQSNLLEQTLLSQKQKIERMG